MRFTLFEVVLLAGVWPVVAVLFAWWQRRVTG